MKPMKLVVTGYGVEARSICASALKQSSSSSEEKRALALATEDADRRLATVKLRALETPLGRDTLGRALFGDGLGGAGAEPVLMFHLLGEYARLFPADRLGEREDRSQKRRIDRLRRRYRR